MLFVLSNCGSTSKLAQVQNETFTYAANVEIMPGGWDPSTDYSSELIAMAQMYEGLTRYNAVDKKVEPLLAESFDSSNGGKQWTFTLRSGVKFHTGRPLTALAAKAAIERTIKLGQGAAYIWDPVKSIDTPDAHTLVFHLKYAAPLDLIASAGYASWIFDTKAAGSGDLGKWFAAGRDAGTGPYTVDTWQPGQEVQVTLKAFPGYWGGWSGTRYQRVVFRYVPAATTTVQLLKAGDVNAEMQLTPQLWASFQNDPNFLTTSTPSYYNFFAMLNTQRAPLSDVRVRQAIAYGINYDGIVAVLKGNAVKSSGIVPAGLFGHFDDLPNYTYDPTKAEALLREAGYGPGGKNIKLVLTYEQGDNFEAMTSAVIKSSLAPLNIDVGVRPLQWSVLWAKTQASDLSQRQDIAIYGWYPDYPDPASWFVNLFETQNPPVYNATYYSNQTVDRMIGEAMKLTASDRPKAETQYRDIQVKLLQDVPAVPLVGMVYQRVLPRSVSGFQDDPAYPDVVFVYQLTPVK